MRNSSRFLGCRPSCHGSTEIASAGVSPDFDQSGRRGGLRRLNRPTTTAMVCWTKIVPSTATTTTSARMRYATRPHATAGSTTRPRAQCAGPAGSATVSGLASSPSGNREARRRAAVRSAQPSSHGCCRMWKVSSTREPSPPLPSTSRIGRTKPNLRRRLGDLVRALNQPPLAGSLQFP